MSPVASLFPPAPDQPTKTLHVVSHGWHTGIVLRRPDVPSDWPVLRDFPRADFLEFGWGDAGYYPAPRGTAWLGLKALCWPTRSVLHVAALDGTFTSRFPESDIVRIELSEPGFARLTSFIEAEFRVDAAGDLMPVGPGLYGDGRFYQARSKFHLCRTCNHWTASALRAAGCPIRPATAVTAGRVMAKTKTFGHSVQDR